jgi:hypothetical protein
MATSACYITTCLHAEKVAQLLEHATISFNLRQGQANSPDLTDFATEVVHDPTDCSFLGGAYTMDCTPSMDCSSFELGYYNLPYTTHGVGIKGTIPYMRKLSPSDPPPSSALEPPFIPSESFIKDSWCSPVHSATTTKVCFTTTATIRSTHTTVHKHALLRT